MQHIKKIILVFSLVIATVLIGFKPASETKTSIPVNEPFTLVELFTSQGCKNSPPAEELFNEVAMEKRDRFFLVAYHIDYWDKLGWKDTFSKPEFSQRQYDYSSFYDLKDHYTPQMVVNGETEFPGSHKNKVEKAITERAIVENELQLTSTHTEDNILINYEVSGDTSNKSMHLFLIQKEATTMVLKGDNKNKKIRQTNIALEYKEVRLREFKGEITLPKPALLQQKDYYIMAFIQDSDSKKVTGIAKID